MTLCESDFILITLLAEHCQSSGAHTAGLPASWTTTTFQEPEFSLASVIAAASLELKCGVEGMYAGPSQSIWNYTDCWCCSCQTSREQSNNWVRTARAQDSRQAAGSNSGSKLDGHVGTVNTATNPCSHNNRQWFHREWGQAHTTGCHATVWMPVCFAFMEVFIFTSWSFFFRSSVWCKAFWVKTLLDRMAHNNMMCRLWGQLWLIYCRSSMCLHGCVCMGVF